MLTPCAGPPDIDDATLSAMSTVGVETADGANKPALGQGYVSNRMRVAAREKQNSNRLPDSLE